MAHGIDDLARVADALREALKRHPENSRQAADETLRRLAEQARRK